MRASSSRSTEPRASASRRNGDAELGAGGHLALGHPPPEVLELVAVEGLARLLEHLALLLLDVMLAVLLHDLGLCAPCLVLDRQRLELAHEQVDDVVLGEPLEDDILRLRVRLQLGVEDL